MRFFPRLRFRTKLNLGMSAILVGMAVLLLPLVGSMSASSLVEESKKRGSALAEGLSVRAVDPMLARDFLRLKNMVDEQSTVEDVIYAFVQDKSGYVMVHTFQKGFPVDLIDANKVATGKSLNIQLLADGSRRIYDFAAPVLVSDGRLGTVRIGLSQSRIQMAVQRQLTLMAGLFAGALFLATSLGTVFARRVTARLALLRSHAEDMLTGNLDTISGPTWGVHCWEKQQCNTPQCPAYGETRRRCWYIAGTMCPDCNNEGNFQCRLQSCRHCPVYRENAGDEIQDLAETFDVMAMTLKSHIGELRDAERNLRDQQRLTRTILDVSPDRVSLVDATMRYRGCNKSFAESVGMSLAEIEGKTDFDLFPEAEAEKRHMAARDILQSGRRLDTQLMVETGGGEHWFHVVCVPVFNDEGRIDGLLRTDRDISDIKRYENQLIQAQKMESLGLLAGGVAHEINTPLGIILGYAQLLQEDVEAGSQIHQDLAIIEKQTQVCKKIVADLLGFSRQTQSAKREMCFNNSVMEAVSLVRHTLELDKVEIVTQLDDRYPIIYGDPEKLKQVWINLLTNSRDAMGGQGGTILIRTRLDTPGGIVSLWVADNGSGIAEEALKKIFDPFFSTKAVDKGTGLGLSVSFGIIEDHGGDIHAASPVPEDFGFPPQARGGAEGGGTVFEVNLPLDHEGPDSGETEKE
ncbi:multi-sensor signal transduction histidine kinase [Pseudodesulfovibrio mercurii]|uniref:histidine kinase n=1 Tax=Pseudodesulfovibrio mercurii TaxID=641491 RepID=F0JD23_9BACT|nr:ATP-binding protein [Pseudodesulfovibrio mercurii]EGB14515.1 multi-sensor signal transduction histidine kinase [Pseudodesulfovibrio mercurii]